MRIGGISLSVVLVLIKHFQVQVYGSVALLRFIFLFGLLDDPGDQILLKIQSAQNRFKSNICVGLVITNPTQLERVQMDIG
jgi:hypothetical protein